MHPGPDAHAAIRPRRGKVVADQSGDLAVDHGVAVAGRIHGTRDALDQLPALRAIWRVPDQELRHRHEVGQLARGAHDSAAVAINASGHSVGYSETPSGGYDAVLWGPKGKATVLTDLGGQGYSQAVAENNNGWSIGFSKTLKGEDAVLWSPLGKATLLKNPGGQGFEYAVAINASEQSVGYADIPGGGTEAVLWQPSGKATNLGASAILGSAWSNTQATGINNNGDIIGFGDYKGEIQGFLLTPAAASVSAIPFSATPVPEASTWAMLVVGFGGLGFAAYRRKQNNRCIE